MNKIKLIVTDLDGTLLNNDQRISAYTAEVLQRAKKAGMSICIASGRYEEMLSIYRDMMQGCDFTLSCNGAVVKREADGKHLLVEALSDADTKRILDYFKAHRLTYMFYSPDTVYYAKGSARMAKRIRNYEELSIRVGFPKQLKAQAVDLNESTDGFRQIIKIVAYEEDSNKLAELRAFCESIEGCCLENTGYGIYGIFARNVSKREGIEVIKQTLGIGSEAVVVFGDWENDLSMFDCADTRVAMANGMDLVNERAKILALSNEEDGVAKVIEQLLAEN